MTRSTAYTSAATGSSDQPFLPCRYATGLERLAHATAKKSCSASPLPARVMFRHESKPTTSAKALDVHGSCAYRPRSKTLVGVDVAFVIDVCDDQVFFTVCETNGARTALGCENKRLSFRCALPIAFDNEVHSPVRN